MSKSQSEIVSDECSEIFRKMKACSQQGQVFCTLNCSIGRNNVSISADRELPKEHAIFESQECRGIEKVKGAKMEGKITKIEESFEKSDNYPNVTERYYKQMYYVREGGPQTEKLCVLLHSNKICLVSLARTHPIIKEKKKVSRLDFQISSKVDRLENKVKGKGKKGGQQIMPDSVLCYAECDDGTRYPILGCVKGKLVEVNRLLLKKPNLVAEKPLSLGFVAIILPSIKDFDVYKQKLLTRDALDDCQSSL